MAEGQRNESIATASAPFGAEAIARAAALIAAGRPVAVPTETVYGLAADARNPQAVARIYAAKGRPDFNPLIVHVPTLAMAETLGEFGTAERALATRFWPGPLTLVLRRSKLAQDFVTGGQDTVGLRVPSHPVARSLLKEFNGGIAAPSANRFGRVSPTTAAHVREDLGGDVDLVLEGGPSEVGIESTIVDFSSGSPVLLRPGRIAKDELEEVLKSNVEDRRGESPRHSGGLERHYAPRTPAHADALKKLDKEIAKLGDKLAVLAFSRPDERVDYWLRMPRDPQAYAQKLYGALRELDGAGCEEILVEAPPDAPEWAAVLDRLRRACT